MQLLISLQPRERLQILLPDMAASISASLGFGLLFVLAEAGLPTDGV